MNPKIVARSALVVGLALWLALTLVASAQGPHPDALSAPAGPPLPSAPGLPRPEAWPLQRVAGRTVAPALSETLGQPALNYRAVRTYGIPGEPYLDTPNHLFEPAGLFVDGGDPRPAGVGLPRRAHLRDPRRALSGHAEPSQRAGRALR